MPGPAGRQLLRRPARAGSRSSGRAGGEDDAPARAHVGRPAPGRGHVRVEGRVGSLLSVQRRASSPRLTGGSRTRSCSASSAGLSLRRRTPAIDGVRAEEPASAPRVRPARLVVLAGDARARRLRGRRSTEPEDSAPGQDARGARPRVPPIEVERVAESILLGNGGIVVAAGHDEVLSAVCTRALLMRGGRIEDDGGFADDRREYLESPTRDVSPATTI